MSAACAQYDLDTGLVRSLQRLVILLRKLHPGVQQSAIQIDGDEANRALHMNILPIQRVRFGYGPVNTLLMTPIRKTGLLGAVEAS